MVLWKWEHDLGQNPYVEPTGKGVSIRINRFHNDARWRTDLLTPNWRTRYPYRIMKRKESIFYLLGNYSWFLPTIHEKELFWVWDVHYADLEKIIRSWEWAAKTQCSGFVVQQYNAQLQVNRVMGFGQYLHYVACVHAGFSIYYSLCLPNMAKLSGGLCFIACMAHFIYMKVLIFHPVYRYRHGRPPPGRGMMRIGHVMSLACTSPKQGLYYTLTAAERSANLFISIHKVHNRIYKQRKYCGIAFALMVYRFWTDPDFILIPRRFVGDTIIPAYWMIIGKILTPYVGPVVMAGETLFCYLGMIFVVFGQQYWFN